MTLEATKICRTCLAMEGTLVSIYETKAFGNSGYVSDVLKELTNIEPNKSDGYPERVCVECVRDINRCYSFKLRCENSHAILGQIFGTTEEQPLQIKEEKVVTENPKSDTNVKLLNQIILLPTSSNLNGIPSIDTETSKKNPLQIKSLPPEPVTKHRKLDSELIILDHQILIPSSVSKQTEASSAVCPKIPIKEDAKVLKTNQGRKEKVDNFDTMIEKLVFEEDVDCTTDCVNQTLISIEVVDNEINKQPSDLENGAYVKKNSSVALIESETANDDIRPIRVDGHSQSSGYESLKNSSLEKDPPSLSYNANNSINRNEKQLSVRCSRYKPKKAKLPPQCAECGKVFSLNSTLYNHMVVHSDQRPYSCKVCNKSFRNKSTFKIHELRHEATKPYKCDECENQFVCMKELKSHKRIHSGKNPYTCKFCSREFRYMNALKSHVRTHTGEKPYACVHCPKRYSQLQSLATHHEVHRDIKIEEMNDCKICKKKILNKNAVPVTRTNINAEKIQMEDS